MSIIIKKLENNREWLYLWGKYITGVNLEEHWAKSLLGSYSKKINKHRRIEKNIVLNECNSEIFYLCGVAKPYKWEKNFHLALRYKKGSKITISKKGLNLEMENAEELPINFDITKCNHIKKFDKKYSTCRNWQFAYLYQDMIRKGAYNGTSKEIY